MNYIENFEEIAKQIIDASPTQKAVDFSKKVIDQVKAQGNDWINDHARDLEITFVPGQDFPVKDNRIFYMHKFQMALNK